MPKTKVHTKKNRKGGYDLFLTDHNNLVLSFDTGNTQESLDFWKDLKIISQVCIDSIGVPSESESVVVATTNQNQLNSILKILK